MDGNPSPKYFGQQVLATSDNQNPMVAVISCIDSRTSPELVLDAGIRDIISIRIAGNIISNAIVGSVELACKEFGVRPVVVMGHSNCGAVIQAINQNAFGNIKWISSEIDPSIEEAKIRAAEIGGTTAASVNMVSMLNLRRSVKRLKDFSPYLDDGISQGEIGLVAGFYNTTTGQVTFDTMEFSGRKHIVSVGE